MQDNKEASKNRFFNVILLVLIGILAVLLIILPAEETLGNGIKLIYFHGAVARTGVIFFALSGLTALASLRFDSFFVWAKRFQLVAFGLWIGHILLSFVSMMFAWGPVWNEPRLQASLVIMVLSYVTNMFSHKLDNAKKTSLAYTILALIVLVLTFTTRKVFHPQNAIGDSPSRTLQILFEAIALTVLLISLQFSRRIEV